jgi:diaminopimelate epimerase
MRIEFTKMSGAGNDFVFLGPWYVSLKNRLGQIANGLCRRKMSVGADGLIMVEKNADQIFMYYFNRDGGEAPFCGNGARCLVVYCEAKGIARGEITFRSRSGVHTGRAVNGGASIRMASPRLLDEASIEVDGRKYDIVWVASGVPHAVILREDIDSVDVDEVGGKIRHHPLFGPEGANVDFLDVSSSDVFNVRTYERGVEQETLACGSGCIACAYTLRLKSLASDVVRLRTASGDILKVRFHPDADVDAVDLSGPASIVYEGVIELKE